MLDGSHYGVKAAEQQAKILRLWIETGAAYPGTSAALGCGMIGNYAENNQINSGRDWPATRAAADAIQRRWAGCHDRPERLLPSDLADERGVSFWMPGMDDPRLLTSRHIVFNLSRSEKSLMLLAPLAARAGGWGLCGKPAGAASSTEGSAPARDIFPDTDDPDYRAILAMIVAGKEYLERDSTRFDMPQFRPRADCVREMKRYGILPKTVQPQDITNVYAVERDYWRSLWYHPLESARTGP